MCNLSHLFGSFTHTFSLKQLIFYVFISISTKKEPKSLTLKFVLFYHKSKIVKIYAVCVKYLAMCVKYLAQKSCHVIFFLRFHVCNQNDPRGRNNKKNLLNQGFEIKRSYRRQLWAIIENMISPDHVFY